jgi:hypothetical protein
MGNTTVALRPEVVDHSGNAAETIGENQSAQAC